MSNAIYSGKVRHRRFIPKKHSFDYRTDMFFLNISSLEDLAKNLFFFGYNKFNLVSFYEKNYLSNYSGSLIQRVKSALNQQGYDSNITSVYILTNLSYIGFCYNPVSFYYCYGIDKELRYILAEVNNTPWNERYVYVLECIKKNKIHRFNIKKNFHVSPFMPKEIDYKWNINEPNDRINVHIQSLSNQNLIFDATLTLQRKLLTNFNLLKSLSLKPLIAQKVLYGIYWQALKLWLRGFKFYAHTEYLNGFNRNQDQ